ncbi:MAG: tetratricopeptide repeat protein [Oligoflexus sp.]
MTVMRSYVREGISSLSILTLMGMLGCATTPSQPGPKKPIAKEFQQTRQSARVIAKPGSKDETSTGQAQDSWEQRYIRTVQPNYQVNEQDLILVQGLNSQSQPLEEAIAVIVVLRSVGVETNQEKEDPGFVARDLSAPTEAEEEAETPVLSLQDEAKKLGLPFSIWNTLAQNPFLQLPIVYRYAEQALQRLGSAPRDLELLTRLIKHRANTWASLLPSENDSQAVSQTPETADPVIGQMQVEPPKVGKYSLADLNRGDALLRQAQRFAERGDFKQAIQYANRIAKKDPLYPAASEKIKTFSNQAVQDLRQKAAQAFQSALPVNDRETRVAYLEQARQYLVQALEEFPEADHLGTVRENLAVISQDLDTLTGQAR